MDAISPRRWSLCDVQQNRAEPKTISYICQVMLEGHKHINRSSDCAYRASQCPDVARGCSRLGDDRGSDLFKHDLWHTYRRSCTGRRCGAASDNYSYRANVSPRRVSFSSDTYHLLNRVAQGAVQRLASGVVQRYASAGQGTEARILAVRASDEGKLLCIRAGRSGR